MRDLTWINGTLTELLTVQGVNSSTEIGQPCDFGCFGICPICLIHRKSFDMGTMRIGVCISYVLMNV